MLMTRRWAAVVVSTLTVAVTFVMTTMLLGMDILVAFVAGADEARSFLEEGTYPLFRMVSMYSALRSFGFSATTAVTGQAAVAIFVLAVICLAVLRRLPVRQSLGLTAIGSLLISPYAYDYDLPILGVGLSLLMSDILSKGSRWEQAVILGLSFVTCIIGLAQTFLRLKAPIEAMAKAGDNMALSFAGLTLLILLGLICRILMRSVTRV
jgi:glucan phosphoethanolaminetransferase (alkaline phosphatase superfamily)